jgi:glycosyltransferase involved in cell wall biosynthesis
VKIFSCLIAGNTDFGPFQIEQKKLGYLNEDELIKAYQSAYIFVCPSLEDSGPLMVNQSIMCGTPVVAFNMGSASDLVKTGETGNLAQYADIHDLAKGIDYMISLDNYKYSEMSLKCRSLGLNVFCTSVYKKHIEEIF